MNNKLLDERYLRNTPIMAQEPLFRLNKNSIKIKTPIFTIFEVFYQKVAEDNICN